MGLPVRAETVILAQKIFFAVMAFVYLVAMVAVNFILFGSSDMPGFVHMGEAMGGSGPPESAVWIVRLFFIFMIGGNLLLAFAPKKPFWWWATLIVLGVDVVSGGPFGLAALIILIGWIGKPVKGIYFSGDASISNPKPV